MKPNTERVVEIKKDGKWVYDHTETGERVLSCLSEDFYNKKLCNSKSITRIAKQTIYDGHMHVVVYYSNGVRALYAF